MPFRLGLTVALLSVVGTFAGGARAADYPVTASGIVFTPPTLNINLGDTVTWTNTGGTHNVSFDDGSFDVPMDPQPGSSWPTLVQRQFNSVGTFRYVCEAHESDGMVGFVTVTSGGPGPGTPPGPAPPGGTPPGGEPPTDPGPGPAPPLPLLKVTLKVSDRTPLAGTRFRLSGEVRPARDGRKVQIQRRGRKGTYKTIATARLKDGGASKSVFSLRLKLQGDAVLRARVAGDDERATGVSKTKAIDVLRPRR